VVYVRDLITCFKFGDDRLRGLASADGQNLPLPLTLSVVITTLSLPCERVMCIEQTPCLPRELLNRPAHPIPG